MRRHRQHARAAGAAHLGVMRIDLPGGKRHAIVTDPGGEQRGDGRVFRHRHALAGGSLAIEPHFAEARVLARATVVGENVEPHVTRPRRQRHALPDFARDPEGAAQCDRAHGSERTTRPRCRLQFHFVGPARRVVRSAGAFVVVPNPHRSEVERRPEIERNGSGQRIVRRVGRAIAEPHRFVGREAVGLARVEAGAVQHIEGMAVDVDPLGGHIGHRHARQHFAFHRQGGRDFIGKRVVMPRRAGLQRQEVVGDAPVLRRGEPIRHQQSATGAEAVFIDLCHAAAVAGGDGHQPPLAITITRGVKRRDITRAGRQPAQFQPRRALGQSRAIIKFLAQLPAATVRRQRDRRVSGEVISRALQRPIRSRRDAATGRVERHAIDGRVAARTPETDLVRVGLVRADPAVRIASPTRDVPRAGNRACGRLLIDAQPAEVESAFATGPSGIIELTARPIRSRLRGRVFPHVVKLDHFAGHRSGCFRHVHRARRAAHARTRRPA